jgi:hypothetical protein
MLSSIEGTFHHAHANLLSFKLKTFWTQCLGRLAPAGLHSWTTNLEVMTLKLGEALRSFVGKCLDQLQSHSSHRRLVHIALKSSEDYFGDYLIETNMREWPNPACQQISCLYFLLPHRKEENIIPTLKSERDFMPTHKLCKISVK